jgi:hypothetical protein
VYDILGNIVINQQQSVTKGNTKMNLNIEGYQNGIYFVRVVDKDNKQIYKGNLIKQ